MDSWGFLRVGAGSPHIKVADTLHNGREVLSLVQRAEEAGVGVLLLPELTITGATAGDIFSQDRLYEAQLDCLAEISEATKPLSLTLILGLYVRFSHHSYSCSAVIQKGKILGLVPKLFNGKSFPTNMSTISIPGLNLPNNNNIPFGSLIFSDEKTGLCFGVLTGSDTLHPCSPAGKLAVSGASLFFCPMAEPETAEGAAYRRDLLRIESAKHCCAYVMSSAGPGESSTDAAYSGQHLIAENGKILAENNRYERKSTLSVADIDCGVLNFQRGQNPALWGNACSGELPNFTFVSLGLAPGPIISCDSGANKLFRTYSKTPFVPENPEAARAYWQEIFQIQCSALAKRLEHTGIKKIVLGVSGGLDSTLALLVAAETLKSLELPPCNLIAVTMPGFGTTDGTYQNALTLMKLLKTEPREIPISKAVLQHFEDIGHDSAIKDLTYENSQARERTQILMDLAGMEGGLVLGTGDLSELALGWCTYNGDHMSMYNVNGGLPKTSIPYVIEQFIKDRLSESAEICPDQTAENELLAKTLRAVLDTPISPELLPPTKDGNIAQKTEDKLGPYELHDFFIYHTLSGGMSPEKLLFVAKTAFEGDYDEETIKGWLGIFYKRFFSQQFKRSCMPDGPAISDISLSPRGGLALPSDASSQIWQ